MNWIPATSLALVTWSSAAIAEEPCPVADNAAIEVQLQGAELAIGGLSFAKFAASMDRAVELVPCATEVVHPDLAARYHLWHGFHAYVDNDMKRAEYALGAASYGPHRKIFDAALVPPGHEVRALYEQAAALPDRRLGLPSPPSGYWVVDGMRAESRSESRAALVQHVGPEGNVLLSTYLLPEDSLPEVFPPEPTGPKDHRKLRGAAWATTAVAAVTSGLLYGLAASSRNEFDENQPLWDQQDLTAARAQTNRLATASGITGGFAALGLGVSLVLQ